MKNDVLNNEQKDVYYVTKIADLENSAFNNTYNFVLSSILTIFFGISYIANLSDSLEATLLSGSISFYCYGKDLISRTILKDTIKKLEELRSSNCIGKSR